MRYRNIVGRTASSKLPQRYTRDALERMATPVLDRMAWGHAEGDRLTLRPDEIAIKYPGDLDNPEHRFQQDGAGWLHSVEFDEPVEISIGRDGRFYLENGHHRWFAAKKLGRSLSAEITKVEGNPIDVILHRQGTS